MSSGPLPWPERLAAGLLLRGEEADSVVGDVVERWHDDLAGGLDARAARRRMRRNLWRSVGHWWKPSAVACRRARRHGQHAAVGAMEPERGGWGGMGTFRQDLRIAARTLTRRPRLALAVVATLALGVGTTATIFSVVEGVVLRPLPFEDPGRLVRVGTTFPSRTWREDVEGLMHLAGMSVANYVDLRARSRTLEELAAVEQSNVLLPDRGDGPELASAVRVSAGFFELLGVTPALGRTFVAEEYDVAAEGEPMMLSWGAWQRRYGGDPSVVGRTVPDEALPVTVVGVLPADFRPPEAVLGSTPDFWMPLQPDHPRYADRGRRSVVLLGRLRPGASLEDARAEGERIAAELARDHPDGNVYPDGTWFGIGVNGLHADTVGGTGRTLMVFLGASALLLLLAALNAAVLLLARALDRTHELGVRVALGAGRARLVRLMLTEAGLLSLVGAGLGIGLAYGGVALFLRFAPPSIPRTDMVGVDGTVLGVALLLSVGAGLAAGVLPAVRSLGRAPSHHLRGGGRAVAGADSRLRAWFVGGQLAIAVLLLSGAGLLVSSFVRLLEVDPGFDARGLVSMRVDLKRPDAPQGEEDWQAWDAVLDEVRDIPGLTAVAGTTNPPFQSPFWAPWIALPGEPPEKRREGIAGYAVTPGYFAAVGTRLLRGRDFGATDGPDDVPVLIVNETFARTVLGVEDPLGATVLQRSGEGDANEYTVVGVVEDVVQTRAEEGALPAVYFSYRQATWPLVQVVVRSDLPAPEVVSALRRAVANVSRYVPPRDMRTMEARMAATRTTPRFHTVLVGSLALIALLLAAAGLYGAQAHAVGRRRRELGVRVALGAGRGGIVGMVAFQGMRVAALGLAVGLVAALALTRVLAGFLFGVEPTDVPTYLGVSLLLLAVALAASVIPALRATRVDPVEVLRAE